MATELKDLSGGAERHEESPRAVYGDCGGEARDEQPLMKSDSPASSATGESMEDLEMKYAPYVREDVYGPMGRGPFPLTEKVLIAIAAVTLVPIRLVIGISIVVVYYLVCLVFTMFSDPNRDEEQEDYAHMSGWRREVIVRCGKFLSRLLLFTMGFYWIRESRRSLGPEDKCQEQPDEPERPGVIVSNHISYVDILYHMATFFPSFVAKRSVAKLPLVGLISKCLGCVFVQREAKTSDFKGVAGVVTERIREAHENKLSPVMLLFPEGTTTNGDFLLPFKTGAFIAKVPVLPVILKYPYSRFSPAWESMSGVRHMFFLLCQFVNYLDVIHLPVYYPSEQEKEDPRLYANNVRKLMASEGNLTLSEIGLPEKRVYHAALNGNCHPRALHQKDD